MTDVSATGIIHIVLSSLSVIAIVGCLGYCLTRPAKTAATYALAVALLFSGGLEVFDLLATLHSENFFEIKRFGLGAEAGLAFAWLLFSLIYARQGELHATSLFQRALLLCSAVAVVVPFVLPAETFLFSPDFVEERILFLNNPGYFFYVFLLLVIIVSLINLEMTLANATPGALWRVKFDVLGAGSYLVLLLIYYSQGLLYRSINMNLAPVRSFALLLGVGMILYSQFRRGGGVKIAVSRTVFYKSIVIFFVGIYLIALGLLGEGMKYFGEGFQRSMLLVLAFLSGLGLVVVLLSGSIKRKITIFLYKNFYQNKYDYRNQWLKFTECLSSYTSGEGLLSSILAGYCDTFGMGGGALYLANEDRSGFSLAATLEMDQAEPFFPMDDPVVELLGEREWVIHISEDVGGIDSAISRFAETESITFLIPLLLNKTIDGFIAIGRPINREESYNFEDYDLMKTFARQASSAILNLHLSRQLVQAKEMEAIGKVSSFVIHDLKNLVYTISLILDNAKEYIEDPEFQQDMLESLGNSVAKMNELIAKLKHVPEKDALRKESLDLLQLCRDTAGSIKGGDIRVSGVPTIAEGDREELRKVALNLLLNAVDATEGKGPVYVQVGRDDAPFFRVKDEGCGITPDFLHNGLFTPFRTTKAKGMGIGLYQCKQITEAHGGKIDVDSEVGKGSAFTVRLPQ